MQTQESVDFRFSETKNLKFTNVIEKSHPHLVEITLKEKLFQNTNKFWEGREALLVHLHQLHRLEPVGHVEADVQPYPRDFVRQFDDGYTSLVQHLERNITLSKYDYNTIR